MSYFQESGQVVYKLDLTKNPKAKSYHRNIRQLIRERGEEGLVVEDEGGMQEKRETMARLFKSLFRESAYPTLPSPTRRGSRSSSSSSGGGGGEKAGDF